MKPITLTEKTHVMCGDPSPELSIEGAKHAVNNISNESDLALLFALVDNKAWWIEDEIYDYEEGSDEYTQAKETIDMWFSMSDVLRKMIFDILRSEGILIPETGQIEVLDPFMRRKGYRNVQGWWQKL